MLLPIVPGRRIRRGVVGVVVAITAILAVGEVFHTLVEPIALVSMVVRVIQSELRWLTVPSQQSFRRSFGGLILTHFGMPPSGLSTWQHPFNGMIVTSVRNLGMTAFQIAGLLLWCAGVLLWAWHGGRGSPERRFVQFALAAALSLIAFHTVYAAHEAYVFSAHIWPYLVLPGVLAWTDGVRTRRFAQVICITAAVVLSAIQTGSGLMNLRGLPGNTGQCKASPTPSMDSWRAITS
jgi:hypothetical protein